MSQAIIVPAKPDRALAEVLDPRRNRELLDATDMPDFLPYDGEFEILVEAVECKAKKNYDNAGVFFTFKVTESNSPMVKVNKLYTICWFTSHPNTPPFVLGKQFRNRQDFAETLNGGPLPTVDGNPDDTEVLTELHNSVEPLGFKMRIKNVFERETRKGKNVYAFKYERAA